MRKDFEPPPPHMDSVVVNRESVALRTDFLTIRRTHAGFVVRLVVDFQQMDFVPDRDR